MSEIAPVSDRSKVRGPSGTNPRATAPWDVGIGAAKVEALAAALAPLDLLGRLAAIRAKLTGRIVFTTSFGLEDQAIAHAIFSQSLAIDVATLDTGRLFPETHEVWAETEQRYGRRVVAFAPIARQPRSTGCPTGHRRLLRSSVAARLECCDVRKVAPLGRALAGASAWITGMRADQSADRARLAFGCVRRASPPHQGEPAV